MRMMFETLMNVGKQLTEVWDESASQEEVGVKDILARYSTDVIASVAFGIEINSLKNPDNEFRRLGNTLTRPGLRQAFVFTLFMAAPKLADFLKVKRFFFPAQAFFVRRETHKG